ncbi:MAG: pilus assembly PilX N-terminal domain-containing protein [bacterium]|nr:pilus assembly PilX N-terminal domain-containing protein [bacterium]
MSTEKKQYCHESSRGQRGTALVLSLFLITVLTVLGTMVLNTSIVEIKMAGNQKISSQVFYAAEAGLERGLLMLIKDFENDTSTGSPWGNTTVAGWSESVTMTTMSGGTTFDPDVRNLAMYIDGNDALGNLKKVTLGGGHTVNNCTFDLYIYNLGDNEVWVLSHAYGNGGTAAVEYYLRVDNVAPYDNAIFSGSGIHGKPQGSVNIAGSIYSRGTLSLGANNNIHNLYGGGSWPGGTMTGNLESLLKPEYDLEAKVRVNGGNLEVDAASTQLGDSVMDTSTGVKGSLAGVYVDGENQAAGLWGDPHYIDDYQQEVPDVPMPNVLDGLKGKPPAGFGEAFINNCITTQGYTGSDAAVATSLYADWANGEGCWAASDSVGVVFDASTIAGSANLIDSSTAAFAFSDGLGNGIFWDPAAGTYGKLTIKGTVVIEGDLQIGKGNGQDDIEYEAYGPGPAFAQTTGSTMFCNGNMLFNGTFAPPAGSGYLKGDTGDDINSLGVITPGNITFNGGPSDFFTGFYFAGNETTFMGQASLAGTTITKAANFEQVPDLFQVPNLKMYRPMGVPGGSDLFLLDKREWRRVY